MAINNLFYNYIDITIMSLIIVLLGFFILLVLESQNYLKTLIIFELLLLLLSAIFLLIINEDIDSLVVQIIALVGGESCLALSIIFPFIIK